MRTRIRGRIRKGSLLKLSVPTSLTASAISGSQINLVWSGTTDEVSIERSTDSVNYTEVGTVAAGLLSFNNTELTADSVYYYRVRTFKGSRYSDYSNVICKSVLPSTLYDAALKLAVKNDVATVIKDSNNKVSQWFSRGASLGSERISNGEFATDTGYSKGAGTTISDGVAHIKALGYTGWVDQYALAQSNVFETGKHYILTFYARQITGSGKLIVGSGIGFLFDGVITSNFVKYSLLITSSGSYDETTLVFGGRTSGDTFELDHISVKEITGNNLTANTVESLPTWNTNEVVFDGISNFMKAIPFTLPQPTIIYAVIKQLSWTLGDRIFDGNENNSGTLAQGTGTNKLYAYAGLAGSDNGDLPINNYGVIRVLFNGAKSSLQINENKATEGNFLNASMNGFTLGKIGTASSGYSNIAVKEIIVRDATSETAALQLATYRYLNINQGLNIRKMVSIGDSITAQQTWQYVLRDAKYLSYNATETTSGTGGHAIMGVGGSCIIPLVAAVTGKKSGNSIYKRADDVDYYNPDIIFLFGGQNDITTDGANLGTIADAAYTGDEVSSNPPSFFASYKGTIVKLKAQNPTAQIVCVTPLFGTDKTTAQKQVYVSAIQACAAAYSLVCADLLNNVGINAGNSATYIADGVHPNAAGGVLIANYLATLI